MRYSELREAPSVIDFDPQVTRQLFDLDLAASQNRLEPKAYRQFRQFLYQHRMDPIRMYHGTAVQHDVMHQGLLPTSAKRRLSLQSGSGYVYVSYDPRRALSFASMGNTHSAQLVVYVVTVPIRTLKPDHDQLRNKRMWADNLPDIGNSLADSLIYGGGARIRGRIEPWQISIYGYFDRSGQSIPAPE